MAMKIFASFILIGILGNSIHVYGATKGGWVKGTGRNHEDEHEGVAPPENIAPHLLSNNTNTIPRPRIYSYNCANAIKNEIKEAQSLFGTELRNEFNKMIQLMKSRLFSVLDTTIEMSRKGKKYFGGYPTGPETDHRFTTYIVMLESIFTMAAALIPGEKLANAEALKGVKAGDSLISMQEIQQMRNSFSKAVANVNQVKLNQQKILDRLLEFFREQEKKQPLSDIDRSGDDYQDDLDYINMDMIYNNLTFEKNQFEKLMHEERSELEDGSDSMRVLEFASRLVFYRALTALKGGWFSNTMNMDNFHIRLMREISFMELDISSMMYDLKKIYENFETVFSSMLRILISHDVSSIRFVTNRDVSKWKLDDVLSNLKAKVKKYENSFNDPSIKYESQSLLRLLEDGIARLINIYSDIELCSFWKRRN